MTWAVFISRGFYVLKKPAHPARPNTSQEDKRNNMPPQSNKYHQFFDDHLPAWITPAPYKIDARKFLPSLMLDEGLTERACVGVPDEAAYFIRTETPWLFHEADRNTAWGDALRADAATNGGKPGYMANAGMLTIGSHPLGSAAWTLGWRAIPGIYHLAAMVGRNKLAGEFEHACREWARDADGVHRLMHKKQAKAFLTTAQEELVRPMLTEIRVAFANVALELEQYDEIRELIVPAGCSSYLEAVFKPS